MISCSKSLATFFCPFPVGASPGMKSLTGLPVLLLSSSATPIRFAYSSLKRMLYRIALSQISRRSKKNSLKFLYVFCESLLWMVVTHMGFEIMLL